MSFKDGKATVRLAARSTDPGAHKYEVRLVPARDSRAGNNVAWWWVEVTQGPSVLLVTAFTDDPLAEVLRSHGIDVEVVTEPSRLHTGSLSGPRAVLINNVPPNNLPAEFLGAVGFFITAQGGGLLMAGGRFSFGSGGYFQSPLDPLLPVSMELDDVDSSIGGGEKLAEFLFKPIQGLALGVKWQAEGGRRSLRQLNIDRDRLARHGCLVA